MAMLKWNNYEIMRRKPSANAAICIHVCSKTVTENQNLKAVLIFYSWTTFQMQFCIYESRHWNFANKWYQKCKYKKRHTFCQRIYIKNLVKCLKVIFIWKPGCFLAFFCCRIKHSDWWFLYLISFVATVEIAFSRDWNIIKFDHNH